VARSNLPARRRALVELDFQVLLALGEGPAHGYAIGKELEARSGGRLNPTTGTLYQALKRLVVAGLIEPREVDPGESGDARRKVFALTRLGRRAAAEEAKRLEALVLVARERKLYGAGA
jgi:DNA-binding PadR family transcriptional regulator